MHDMYDEAASPPIVGALASIHTYQIYKRLDHIHDPGHVYFDQVPWVLWKYGAANNQSTNS